MNVSDQNLLNRSTPQQLAAYFLARTGCEHPPPIRIYRNDTPSLVGAVPEFADMGAVLIAYPGSIKPPIGHSQEPPSGPRSFGIPSEMIIRMQQNDTATPVHILVMCADVAQRDIILRDLQQTADKLSLKFNPDHLQLVGWDTDTFWTRDYGPWWVYDPKNDTYAIAKHTHTTMGGGAVGFVEGAEKANPLVGLGIFRPNDDYGAVKLSDFLNGPIRKWNTATWPGDRKQPQIAVHDWYYLGLLNVGGNFMVNGKGVVASTYLAVTQNEGPGSAYGEMAEVVDKRAEYILSQLNRFMGLHTYHVLSDPTGTYIEHIDCWGKFLAEDKVLVASSQDQKTNQAFDAIAASFEKEDFKVYRVLCQDIYVPNAKMPATTAAYTNSLILNHHVYVPISGRGYENYDRQALSVYKEALPDYTVVGIAGKPEFPWLGTDAVHCRTRAIPRKVIDNWQAALHGAPPWSRS
ncbi:agmatine deiminase family protein [Paraburkholderia sp. MM5477-R1]|uniref:agmatine deiminase family protein n=1 Tax=Paraburkholderia sp. MM5477-R1 TaxID=2991062 RepID=UPI003D1F2169